jgi:hypothetical protein
MFLAGALSPTTIASPLSFTFQAQVNSVTEYANPSFSLPFAVAPGQTIQGTVTLPDHPDADGARRISLQLSVAGTSLQSTDYEFAVLNDISSQLASFSYDGIRTGPIEVIPPGVLRAADTGISPLNDRVFLVCNPASGPLSCPAGRVPNAEQIAWQPVLSFVGPDSVLQSESLPLTAAEWNAFSARALSLGFEIPGQAGAVIVTASIGEFNAVPEPTTVGCAVAGFSLVWLFVRNSVRRR